MDLTDLTRLVIDALQGADRAALAELAGYDPEVLEDLVCRFLRAGIEAIADAPKQRPGGCPVIPLYPLGEAPGFDRARDRAHGGRDDLLVSPVRRPR
jgi:hypothetical protein